MRLVAIAAREKLDILVVMSELFGDFIEYGQRYIELLRDPTVSGEDFIRRLRVVGADNFIEDWIIRRETGGLQ